MSEQHKYTLVCFLNELCNGQKSIDIVPSKWIHDKMDEGHSLCAFPDKFTDFDKLVKSRKAASKSWTLYPVIIKGHADTYEDGLKKLKRLEQESEISTDDVQSQNLLATDKEKNKKQNRLKGKTSTKNNTFQPVLSTSVNLTKPLEKTISNIMTKKPGELNFPQRTPTPPLSLLQGAEDSCAEDRNTSVDTDLSSSLNFEMDYSSEIVDEPEGVNGNTVQTKNVTGNSMTNPPIVDKQCSGSQEITLATLTKDIRELKEIFTHDIKKIASQLSTLQSEVIAMKIQLQKLVENRPYQRATVPVRKQTADLNLPFTSLESFREFDEKLKTNEELRKEIGEIMWSLIEVNKPLNKTLTNIFAKFCSREVLCNYTAKNPVPGKQVMRDTTFHRCAFDKVNEVYKKYNEVQITEAAFYKGIGAVINCSRDWGGQRSKRNKKARNTNDGSADGVEDGASALHDEQ